MVFIVLLPKQMPLPFFPIIYESLFIWCINHWLVTVSTNFKNFQHMSLSVISNGTLLFYEVISNEKNNRDSLIHCCLSDANWWIWRRLLLQASGKKSVTPLKRKLYTKKINKQGEELHLSLKGKGPYTIYKTDSNKNGITITE